MRKFLVRTGSVTVIGLLLFSLYACSTVKVHPPLSTSLGYDAFANMKKIDQKNVNLAVYFDPKIRELKIDRKIKMGEFSFLVGEAFSVKMIKALSHNFKSVELVDKLTYDRSGGNDALMFIQLQDVDVDLKVKAGWSTTVSSEGYTHLSIRADLRDLSSQRVVWVGTASAKQSEAHQEFMQMQYQEAGRGFANAIDAAIDKAVGDLINQMSRSQNLKQYLSALQSGGS